MRIFNILISLTILCLPVHANAHPHAWISFKTTFVFNDSAQIIAIKEHWLFDKMYTAFALQDFDPNKNGKLDKDELMQLAQENLQGLSEFKYFTTIEIEDGKPVATGTHTAIDSYLENNQIAIDFTLPLNAPIDVKKHKIVYRIYDPTYYTDMGHYEKNPVHFEGAAPKNCKFEIARPSVDIAKIASAAALDKKATAPKDFGFTFAEKAIITCQ